MAKIPLLTSADCALVLVDEQAGLAFAAGSADRQLLRSNAVALARTAIAFSIPVVVSTSASKVYNGPLMLPLWAVLADITPIERRNMNLWEDETAKAAIVATGLETLVFAGLLTEACVSFPVLSAQENQSINGVTGTTPVVATSYSEKAACISTARAPTQPGRPWILFHSVDNATYRPSRHAPRRVRSASRNIRKTSSLRDPKPLFVSQAHGPSANALGDAGPFRGG